MKFGKRLAAESARTWPEACLDYKAIKRALKCDLASGDAVASGFLKQLLAELNKVSAFYVQQAALLESSLAQHVASANSPSSSPSSSPRSAASECQALRALRAQIRQLIKFVALNYLAVVKAIKKRNRHCRVVFGAEASGPALHPLDLLRQEVFFTSPRLAALATQAEVLEAAATAAAAAAGSDDGSSAAAAEAAVDAAAVAAAAAAQHAAAGPGSSSPGSAGGGGDGAAAAAVSVEDYQCPICLDVLRSPVVLNCAHRFCWGCLVAHCAATTGPSSHAPAAAAAGAPTAPGGDAQSAAASAGSEGSSSSSSSSSSGKGLVALEKLVAAGGVSSGGGTAEAASGSSSSSSSSDCYNCPVCRQPQVLEVDNLQVDPHLSRFVEELRCSMKTQQQQQQQQQQQGDAASSLSSAGTALAAVSRSSSFTSTASTATTVTTASVAAAALSRSASELSVATELPQEPVLPEQQEQGDWSKYLLPRQLPHHAGRLTVLLDLDGTLVSSFTPRRAPPLPRSMRTHLVGQGSSLNPGGVFVVERPGLGQFLRALAGMAEVVVFTAGLEEYAAPIIDAIDPTGAITDRLYRPACQRTPHHQCVKDLAMLGRPLSRTVLVDDTPLAFLHQPECGVPVLQFRGDPDDRLLMEAVLPLVQTLAAAPDVRPVLTRRFDMLNWFKRHGYPDSIWRPQQQPQALAQQLDPTKAATKAPHPSQPARARAAADVQVVIEDAVVGSLPTMLVFDFDRTISEWDAGERIVSQLAPELLPWLHGLESPANFVPVTNEILAEMSRRGISRDRLLLELQALGAELPPASGRMLRWAKAQVLPVVVLSDCNAVFIRHILAGAQLGGYVDEVVTNGAEFERVAGAGDAAGGLGLGSAGASSSSSGGGGGGGGADSGAASDASSATGLSGAASTSSAPSSFKLVIQPRQPESHSCPLCPSNLCKGLEMQRLVQQQQQKLAAASGGSGGGGTKPAGRGRIVYAGDGANDICPALALGPHDVVLAKAGAALARYVAASQSDGSLRQVRAAVHVWDGHEQLEALVRQHGAASSSACSPTSV